MAAPAHSADHGAASDDRQAVVRAAIVRAVSQRLGQDALVVVDELTVLGQVPPAGSQLLAVPDAGARTGHPSRFVLKWMIGDGRARRYGEARATVRVTLTHSRVVRPVERGRPLQTDDVEQVRADATGLALRPLPASVIGARVLHDLAPGTVITQSHVKTGPLVKSGDIVVTVVRFEGISVQATAVAAQDGRLGQTIRVVNPASGRRLKATVIGAGEVEVNRGA